MTVWLLARGLLRDAPKPLVGTAIALGLAVAAAAAVQATFDGVHDETVSRVSDIWTGEHRLAKGGLVPARTPFSADEVPAGADVHVESQVLLSRRGFLSTAVFEDEAYHFGDTSDAIGLGVLIGYDANDTSNTRRLDPYLLDGGLVDGSDTVGLVVPLRRLPGILSASELAALPDPPTVASLSGVRLEVTAGVIDHNSSFRDVIRSPARITGLMDTGIHASDQVAILTTAKWVRHLNGWPDGTWNVQRLDDPVPGSITAAQFTDRHVGQALGTLERMAQAAAVATLVLPGLLLYEAVARRIHTHRGPLTVAVAIGVPPAAVLAAQAVVGLVLLAGAAGLAILVSLILAGPLQPWFVNLWDLPLPARLDYRQTAAWYLLVPTIAFALSLWRRTPDLATATR